MTDLESPSFYAILTADVRYDKSIPANAKLLFAEITALANKEGYCFASNNYFARLYKVTPQAISKWVNLLQKAGYIIIDYIRDGKEIKERHIFVGNKSKNVSTNIDEVSTNIDEVSTNIDEGINKGLMGYQQKIKDNITNNNKLNNTLNTPTTSDYEDRIAQLEKELEESKKLNEANASVKKEKKSNSKKTPTFSNTDYSECMDIYYRNRQSLNESGISTSSIIYKIPVYKKLIKEFFITYGVEDVKKAVTNSINNYWIKTKTDYSLRTVFNYAMFDKYINDERGEPKRVLSSKGSAFEKAGGFDSVNYAEGF